MNKQQFLTELKKHLFGLPQDDIKQSLDYYAEMIDDRIEDGISEEDAVSDIGDPQEIAKQILMDTPMTKLVRAKAKPSRTLRAWETVLLILGSPIWLSLLIAAAAVVLSVYVVLWSVIISLYAVDFSLAACGVAGVLAFGIVALKGDLTQGLFFAGCSLLCMGLAILLFFGFNQVTKGLLWASKKIWIGIKSCFIRRGDGNENR